MPEQLQTFDSLTLYTKKGASSRNRFDAPNPEEAMKIVLEGAEKVADILGFEGVEVIKLYNGLEEFVFKQQDGNWQRQQNKQ